MVLSSSAERFHAFGLEPHRRYKNPIICKYLRSVWQNRLVDRWGKEFFPCFRLSPWLGGHTDFILSSCLVPIKNFACKNFNCLDRLKSLPFLLLCGSHLLSGNDIWLDRRYMVLLFCCAIATACLPAVPVYAVKHEHAPALQAAKEKYRLSNRRVLF